MFHPLPLQRPSDANLRTQWPHRLELIETTFRKTSPHEFHLQRARRAQKLPHGQRRSGRLLPTFSQMARALVSVAWNLNNIFQSKTAAPITKIRTKEGVN
jgi:hypothetical protein